jgi:hypothetical protein
MSYLVPNQTKPSQAISIQSIQFIKSSCAFISQHNIKPDWDELIAFGEVKFNKKKIIILSLYRTTKVA